LEIIPFLVLIPSSPGNTQSNLSSMHSFFSISSIIKSKSGFLNFNRNCSGLLCLKIPKNSARFKILSITKILFSRDTVDGTFPADIPENSTTALYFQIHALNYLDTELGLPLSVDGDHVNIILDPDSSFYDDAETLKYNNNLELIEIGKKFKKKEEPKSQFMGLIFIPQKKISQIIKYYNKNKLQKMQTTDVLNLLLRKKEKVKVLPTKSFWYEFDDYEDLHNYNKKFK